MKYMLILAADEGGWEDRSPEEAKAEMGRWQEFGQELVDAGAWIAGEGLQESATATTVRIGDDGERVVTDGPFAETKEQVGGFYLLECDEPRRGARVGEEGAAPRAAGSRSGR